MKTGWPEGYFENVLGNWQGELERPAQGDFELRNEFCRIVGLGLDDWELPPTLTKIT